MTILANKRPLFISHHIRRSSNKLLITFCWWITTIPAIFLKLKNITKFGNTYNWCRKSIYNINLQQISHHRNCNSIYHERSEQTMQSMQYQDNTYSMYQDGLILANSHSSHIILTWQVNWKLRNMVSTPLPHMTSTIRSWILKILRIEQCIYFSHIPYKDELLRKLMYIYVYNDPTNS